MDMSEENNPSRPADEDAVGDHQIEHDPERMTFEIELDKGLRAVLEYRSNREGKMFLTNTEVPEQMRGKGIAAILVKHALDFARENNYRIIPVCSYVKSYLKRYPEYQSLMASGIRLT